MRTQVADSPGSSIRSAWLCSTPPRTSAWALPSGPRPASVLSPPRWARTSPRRSPDRASASWTPWPSSASETASLGSWPRPPPAGAPAPSGTESSELARRRPMPPWIDSPAPRAPFASVAPTCAPRSTPSSIVSPADARSAESGEVPVRSTTSTGQTPFLTPCCQPATRPWRSSSPVSASNGRARGSSLRSRSWMASAV